MLALRITSYAVCDLFFMLFLLLFQPQRFSRKKALLICAFAMCLLLLDDALRLTVAEKSLPLNLLLQALSIIWIQTVAFILSRTRDSRALFTNLSASAYILVGNVTGTIFYTFTQNRVGAYAVASCIHMLLLVLLVRYVRRPFLNMLSKAGSRGFGKLCSIPVLFYATVTLLCFYPHPLYALPVNILPAVLLLLTMFISYVMVFQVLENEVRRSEYLWNNRTMESYARGLNVQHEAVVRAQQSLRILRHDLRHYMASLSVLLEEEKYGEAKEVLGVLTDEVEENRVNHYCENSIVNSVLCSIIDQAEKEGIRVHTKIAMPERMELNSIELAAVLANLLENAALAVRELEDGAKQINILARYEPHRLILEVTNRCAGQTVFGADDGLPATSRGEGHGLGLQSVAAFAQKNQASFDCYRQEDIFTARLFWNQPESRTE